MSESDNGQIIQVEAFTKKYGNLVAVDDISFTVNAGEIFGFLGPNGAGKTTTINVLCTLLRPTEGRVALNGYDVMRNPHQVRKSIGLVFQDPSLDDRLTARENLQFHAMVYGVKPDLVAGRIDEVLEMMELVDRQHHLVRTFSGGMKRRLEIARGLLHYPRVLFLDEPTLGLDPQTRSKIWEYIHDLRRREDITIFMTTHYMDEAENCDRIGIIDHGKIVALDTPEQLKKMVGGDIITVKAAGDDLSDRIARRYGVEVRKVRLQNWDHLQLEMENGHEFIPRLVGDFPGEVLSVGLSKPTLDDVFLKLTGRAIREESPSARERMRLIRRRFH